MQNDYVPANYFYQTSDIAINSIAKKINTIPKFTKHVTKIMQKDFLLFTKMLDMPIISFFKIIHVYKEVIMRRINRTQGDQTEFGIKFQIFNEKTPKKHQI